MRCIPLERDVAWCSNLKVLTAFFRKGSIAAILQWAEFASSPSCTSEGWRGLLGGKKGTVSHLHAPLFAALGISRRLIRNVQTSKSLIILSTNYTNHWSSLHTHNELSDCRLPWKTHQFCLLSNTSRAIFRRRSWRCVCQPSNACGKRTWSCCWNCLKHWSAGPKTDSWKSRCLEQRWAPGLLFLVFIWKLQVDMPLTWGVPKLIKSA